MHRGPPLNKALASPRIAVPVQYRLEVVGERAADIHRTRNFAEELHFTLRERGLGTTSNPDTMTTELVITVPVRRNLGEARQLLRHLLAKHFMEADVNVQRM
jgi:hypothetical protein